MAKKEKAQKRDLLTIMNNPADESELKSFVDEAVDAMRIIDSAKETFKALRDEAIEKMGMEGKDFNWLVRLYFRQEFDKEYTEAEKKELVLSKILNKEA